ncbi:MAG: hypothetical protein AAGD35_11960 [Actinomycetota bacterium]
MSGSGGDAGRLRAISVAGRFVAHLVSPAPEGWDLSRASVATWVLTHVCVASLFGLTVMVDGVTGDRSGEAAVIVVWLVVTSGLCGRLALLLLIERGLGLGPLWWRRPPFELVFGVFAVLTYAALVAAQTMGPGVEAAFLATLALLTGLRVAGLDALMGVERPVGFYVRSVYSLTGAVVFAGLVLVAVVLFAVVGRVVDPRLQGMERTVEEWLAVDIDRWAQFRALVIGLLLLAPFVTLVCEAVAAVGRHEADLGRRLSEHEQRAAREVLAQGIHDGDLLSLIERARRATDELDRLRLLSTIELRLRELQVERHQDRGDRIVRSCLRRPLSAANRLGLAVELDCDVATLDHPLDHAAATLFERLMMVQFDNSFEVGATSVKIRIEYHLSVVRVTYVDDGGGFDPAEAERAGGGLARLKFDIEQSGGRLWFERGVESTSTHVVLPSWSGGGPPSSSSTTSR